MSEQDTIDLKRLYYIFKRHIVLIVGIVVTLLIVAVMYLATTPEKYTAETVILLDKSISNSISDVSSLNLATYEPAAIDSEVEVLRSKRITDAVVKLLEPKNYFSYIPKDQDRRDFILFQIIQSNMSVSRVEKTYALSIRYKSTDPQIAADIANAFAEVYIADQLDSLSETSERTITWLQAKAQEIKEKSRDARERLAKYRAEYNAESQKNIRKSKKNKSFNQEVRLREFLDLEQEIETFDTIYESYLEKIRTISLESSFPVTETRVITYATAPLHKSEPKSKIIIGAAIILGTGIGILIALIIDFFDKTLKRAGQAKRELRMTFLGFLPKIRQSKQKHISFVSSDEVSTTIGLYTQSVDDEQSLCAETIRTIKNLLDYETEPNKSKVVGILSTFEDKDTHVIASNLAVHCAHEGAQTLFFASDIQNADSFTNKTMQNFLLENVFYSEDYNLNALINELDGDTPNQRKFNAQRMASLLDVCRKQYDYTIIDLPPMHATSNLHTYIQSVDHFIIVAEWGKTLPNTLNFYLQQNRLNRDKVAGVVLSKANMKKMKSHYGHVAYQYPKE